MSLFGSLLGDMENDPFFGSHMRTMRHMNNMMNSLLCDPFGLMGGLDGSRALTHHASHDSLLPFQMAPVTPAPLTSFNRLLGGSFDTLGALGGAGGHSYSSSTVVSMTSGPDGRPQVYKATSSTRTAPGGIKETQRTVSDSMSGTKKMAIGHHIGDRAHIIEKEHNLHTGDREERQDFINLEEEEAEDFNREWETKTRRSEIPRITAASSRNRHTYGGHSTVPAITAGSSGRRQRERHSNSTHTPLVTGRRGVRSSPLAITSSQVPSGLTSNRSPYCPPGTTPARKNKNIKTVSGSSEK